MVFSIVLESPLFDGVLMSEEKTKTPREKTSPDLVSSIVLLKRLAESSREISDKIYKRATLFLWTGLLIALFGLVYLHFQNNLILQAQETSTRLLRTLTRLGIFFFIESIPFFLLKQYRTTMAQYRYFESVKRRREENLAIITIIFSHQKNLDFVKLFQQISIYSDLKGLTNGGTLEKLESKKLTNPVTPPFEKIFKAIAQLKGLLSP